MCTMFRGLFRAYALVCIVGCEKLGVSCGAFSSLFIIIIVLNASIFASSRCYLL